MTEHPFPVRPLESMWRDDAWNYEAPCTHGNGWDCHQCHLAAYMEATVAYEAADDEPPYTPRDLPFWGAIILVAAGGAITVAAFLLLSGVIRL